MSTRRLYIKTYGCQMNDRDSEIIEQLLAPAGYQPTTEAADADLIILNTCSIRAKAEQKVFSLLGSLRQEKKNRPGLRIGVCGCVAQQEGKRIFQRMPHVDFVVGTQQVYQLAEIIERLENDQSHRELATELSASFEIPRYSPPSPSSPPTIHSVRQPSLKKSITIMQGCNNYCAYCVVPTTRGREISRPMVDIIDEARTLIAQGVKEITLLGQNVNSYGKTNAVADHPVDFADLLQMTAELPNLQRLRFTTSNPMDLTDKLMQVFGHYSVICPHFHLPVQSGSDRVLKRMKRKYTIAEYLKKVETLRALRPEMSLTTDMIIGFPGETDEDFAQTVALLNKVCYHASYSFKYSPRTGTRAATFDDQIEESVKAARLWEFQQRQAEICLEKNQSYIGKTLTLMVEDTGAGRATTNQLVHFPAPESLKRGDFVAVKITAAGKFSLRGELAR